MVQKNGPRENTTKQHEVTSATNRSVSNCCVQDLLAAIVQFCNNTDASVKVFRADMNAITCLNVERADRNGITSICELLRVPDYTRATQYQGRLNFLMVTRNFRTPRSLKFKSRTDRLAVLHITYQRYTKYVLHTGQKQWLVNWLSSFPVCDDIKSHIPRDACKQRINIANNHEIVSDGAKCQQPTNRKLGYGFQKVALISRPASKMLHKNCKY